MWTTLLLLLCAEPAAEKTTWRILFADEKGGYWVDARTGAAEYDGDLAREPRKAEPKPPVDDGRSQLREPPPPLRRYGDPQVSTANGVTVRAIKHALQLEADGERRMITNSNFNAQPVVRPDGKAVAYLHWDGKSRLGGKARLDDLVLLDLRTKESTTLMKRTVIHGVAWMPDGKRLVVGLMGSVVLIDGATGKIEHTWSLPAIDKRLSNHGPTTFVVHPQGDWIATRCTFVGGREAGTRIFGDAQMILLSKEKTRVVDLPRTTCEGPVRGEVDSKVEKAEAAKKDASGS